MFASIRALIYRLSRSLMTTRQQLLIIFYFSYIWDAVRKEYIESRKRYYDSYCNKYWTLGDKKSAQYESSVERDNVFFAEKDNQDDYTLTNSDQDKSDHKAEADHETFQCPLIEMPFSLRVYQLVSTSYMVYSMIKYALVSLIQYGWLGVDKSYACYLPGRIGIVQDISYEAPWWGFVIFGLHVVWRSLWYLAKDRLDLDCLLFLCHDESTVLDKQVAIVDMDDGRSPAPIAVKKYLCNNLFYEQYPGARGRIEYSMKQHRTVEQYCLLERLSINFRILYVIVISMLFLPMFIYGVVFRFSSESLAQNYPLCVSSDAGEFKVKLGFTYPIFDLLDNIVLIIESPPAFIVPYSGFILITQDLTFRFDALCRRVTILNEVLRSIPTDEHKESLSMGPPLTIRFFEDLEEQCSRILFETKSTFEQVRHVDQYLRRNISFCVLGCYIVTSTILALLIFRRHVISGELVALYTYLMIYTQIFWLGAIFFMVRPMNRSQALYGKLCSAMALCSDIETIKVTWCWLLEFYHKDAKRNTLHIFGETYALSSLNVLRCMSWIIICTVALQTLIRERSIDLS